MGQSASSTSRHEQLSARTVLHSTAAHSNQKRNFLGRLASRFHKRPLFHRGRTQPAPLNSVLPTGSSVRRERQEPAWAAMMDPAILSRLSSQPTPSDSTYGRTILSQDNTLNYQSMLTATRDPTINSNAHDVFLLESFQLPGFPDRLGAGDIASLRNAIDNLEPHEASPLPVLLSLILLSFFDGLTNDTPEAPVMPLQGHPPESSALSTETPFSFFSHDNDFTGDINNVAMGDYTPSAQRFLSMMRTMGNLFLPENVSFEEMLMLDFTRGLRPFTTTQAALNEAIPAENWSDSMKKELIGTDECQVCLDAFESAQPVRVLKCRHVFHRDCVDRWLCDSRNSCPVCRRVPVESTI